MLSMLANVFSIMHPATGKPPSITAYREVAPPKLLPWVKIFVLSISYLLNMYFKIDIESYYNPDSDGVPSLSLYPLYATIKIFVFIVFI